MVAIESSVSTTDDGTSGTDLGCEYFNHFKSQARFRQHHAGEILSTNKTDICAFAGISGERVANIAHYGWQSQE